MARSCPACGRANDDDASFCQGCGATLAGPDGQAGVGAPPTSDSADVPPPPASRLVGRRSGGRRSRAAFAAAPPATPTAPRHPDRPRRLRRARTRPPADRRAAASRRPSGS